MYEYPGSYPDFLRHAEARGLGQEEIEVNQEEVAEKREKALAKADRVERYKEDKRVKREVSRLTKLVGKLEGEIAEKEIVIKKLTVQMTAPELSTDFAKLGKLSDERDKEKVILDKLTNDWENALMQLEELGT